MVEDDVDLALLLQVTLELGGWEVTLATDGDDAFAATLTLLPDLDVVITDVMMPSLDGWQLLERLTTDGRTRGVPVIVLSTSWSTPGWHALALRRGASEALSLPVHMTDVLAAASRAADSISTTRP